MVSDEEIEQREKELAEKGFGRLKLPTDKIIWESIWLEQRESDDEDNDFGYDYIEVPIRLRRDGVRGGYFFEILRPMPDGRAGEIWSPMSPKERKEMHREMFVEYLKQLEHTPRLR